MSMQCKFLHMMGKQMHDRTCLKPCASYCCVLHVLRLARACMGRACMLQAALHYVQRCIVLHAEHMTGCAAYC
jgi:hypothetical protein